MRAAIVTAAGLAPVLADLPVPVPQEGEVAVSMRAAALNQLSRARASGRHYSTGGVFPVGVGVDGVGVTAEGRRVYGVLPRAPLGTMAGTVTFPATHLVAVPDDLDDVTAAALANPGMSGWAALDRAGMSAGETVLVHGATGASGRLAVAIARHRGAGRVIATGRNRAVLESLGADAVMVLDGDMAALAEQAQAVFAAGVDVVLDYLYGPTAAVLLAAAAGAHTGGRALRFVNIGSMTGGEIALPAAVLRSADLKLMGSGIGSVPMAGLLAAIGGVLAAAGSAGFTVAARAEPLEHLPDLWSASEAGDRLVFTL